MMNGFIILEFCDANPASELQTLLQNEFPEITILENSCMSECQLCEETWYAFIDGELVSGEDKETFLKEIRAFIQRKNDL
jgi:uncharacterized protein YuzB (UPF0349 family)